LRRAVLYYTCLTHPPAIERACRSQLDVARATLPLVTVSRGAPIDFGDARLVVEGERSPLTMHRQVLAGLEACDADAVFLCESDVLYHPSHFEFEPPDGTFVYNVNVWKAFWPDGRAVWTDGLEQVSGLCAGRELLLEFYRAKVAQIEAEGFDRHYEPGRKQRVGGRKVADRLSLWPNLDVRHGGTLTRSKRSPEEFRNPRYAAGWREESGAPWWGRTEGCMEELLRGAPYSCAREDS